MPSSPPMFRNSNDSARVSAPPTSTAVHTENGKSRCAIYGILGGPTNNEALFAKCHQRVYRDNSCARHRVLAVGLCNVAWSGPPRTFVNKMVGVLGNTTLVSTNRGINCPPCSFHLMSRCTVPSYRTRIIVLYIRTLY